MTKLLPNTTYYVRVKSVNLEGESDYSNTISVTTSSSNSLLENPTSISPPNIKEVELGDTYINVILYPFSKNEYVKEIKVTLSTFSDLSAPLYEQTIFSIDINTSVHIEDNYSYINLNIPYLSPNTTYYCKLISSNKNSLSSDTNFNFKTNYSLKSPNLLGVTNLSQINAKLNWTQIDNATGYDIQVSTSNNFNTLVVNSTSTTTSFNINTLFQNTTYWARVRAKTTSVTSPYSNIISFTTLNAVNTLPELNKNLANIKYLNIIYRNLSSIKLTWSSLENADAYEINVSLNSNFTTLIGSTITTKNTEYIINNLNSNTLYYIRVRGKDSLVTNTFSEYKIVSTSTLNLNFNLLPVQILSPTNIYSTAIELLWISRTYAISYLIEVSNSNNFNTILFSTYTTNTDNYLLSYLTPNTNYFIRIFAISTTDISTSSNILNITTSASLLPITGLTHSDLSNNSVTLSWTGNLLYTKYSISIYKKYNDTNFSRFLGENYFNNLDIGNNTSIHIDYFLEGGNTYKYFITGFTASGDNFISEESEFTTLELPATITLSPNSEYIEWSGNITHLLISLDKEFKYILPNYNYRPLSNSYEYISKSKRFSIRNLIFKDNVISPKNYFIRGIFDESTTNILSGDRYSVSNILSTYQEYPCILPIIVSNNSAIINIRRNYSESYTIQFKVKSGNNFLTLAGFEYPVNIGNNTTYNLSNLTANTEYQVIVRFLNTLGNYELVSSPITFKTNSYSNILEPSLNNTLILPIVTISNIESDRFLIKINSGYNLFLLKISRHIDKVDTFRYIELTNSSNLVEYELVVEDDSYYYVDVVGISNNSRTDIVSNTVKTLENSNIESVITITPSISSALILNENEAIVTISTIPNAKYYKLEVASNPNFNILDYDTSIIKLPDNKYLLSGLLGSRTYYVRAYAYNSVSISNYSPIIIVDTVP